MSANQRVLLLTSDPMAAALLGLLAERAGFAPAFADPGEDPAEAVERLRPAHVVLLDANLDVVRSDLFFHRLGRQRVGLAILLPEQGEPSLATWAREREVPCVDIPTEPEQFARIVDAASASDWWRSGRDRRFGHQAERGADGTLTYVDRRGRRWKVLDRRGSDRRQNQFPERVFVDDQGTSWWCVLRATENGEATAGVLERQLARARRVD